MGFSATNPVPQTSLSSLKRLLRCLIITIDIIYLDFGKAFEKVPKVKLIKKLEAHGG